MSEIEILWKDDTYSVVWDPAFQFYSFCESDLDQNVSFFKEELLEIIPILQAHLNKGEQ